MSADTIKAFRSALIETDKLLSESINARAPKPNKPAPKKQVPKGEQQIKDMAKAATTAISAYANPIGTLFGLITKGPKEDARRDWAQFYGATMTWLDNANTKSSSFAPDLAQKLEQFQRYRAALKTFVPNGFPAVTIPMPSFDGMGASWQLYATIGAILLLLAGIGIKLATSGPTAINESRVFRAGDWVYFRTHDDWSPGIVLATHYVKDFYGSDAVRYTIQYTKDNKVKYEEGVSPSDLMARNADTIAKGAKVFLRQFNDWIPARVTDVTKIDNNAFYTVDAYDKGTFFYVPPEKLQLQIGSQ